jgi:hypothetical protein
VLAAGAGVVLMVGASAFGDTVCGTPGDVSDCAQWGVNGNATRLVVKNTGTQTISSVTFTLPAGANVYGVAGNTGCTNGPGTNQISCNTAIAPGQTLFFDILSSQVTVGSTGTLTLKDAGGVQQPGQTVALQSASVCGGSMSTPTCTIGSGGPTPTGTGTPTGAPCHAKLEVTKNLESSKHEIKLKPDLYVTYTSAMYLKYEIFVTNDSACPAAGVVITDPLPRDFRCHAGVWHVLAQHPGPNGFECHGEGEAVRVDVGALGAHQTVVVALSGTFPRERTTANTAHAIAANAPGAHSNHVHVDVVSEARFLRDKGMLKNPGAGDALG